MMTMSKIMRNNKSRVDEDGRAPKGSQRQIQTYVNEHQEMLTQEVLKALPSLAAQQSKIKWVSPLQSEHYAEYYDQGLLRALEHPELTNILNQFWPRKGPHWDALAVVEMADRSAGKGVLLVEAKSYRLEVTGVGTQADGESLRVIIDRMRDTAKWLGVTWRPSYADLWTGTLYQYANRLAYLYFFREIAKIPAWLVNIYFLNDPYRPTSREQWNDFLPEVKWRLGIQDIQIPHATDLFVEATR